MSGRRDDEGGFVRPTPAIFVGNVECQNDTKELSELFEEFGEVSYVDAKKGFAFVVMPVRSEAERAINELKGKRFGPFEKELLVEWSRGNGASKRRELDRQNAPPSSTLFVAGFGPESDVKPMLEKMFEGFGKLIRVDVRPQFAFIQFAEVEDARKALEETAGKKIGTRTLSVEFSVQNNGGFSRTMRGGRDGPRDGYGGRGYGGGPGPYGGGYGPYPPGRYGGGYGPMDRGRDWGPPRGRRDERPRWHGGMDGRRRDFSPRGRSPMRRSPPRGRSLPRNGDGGRVGKRSRSRRSRSRSTSLHRRSLTPEREGKRVRPRQSRSRSQSPRRRAPDADRPHARRSRSRSRTRTRRSRSRSPRRAPRSPARSPVRAPAPKRGRDESASPRRSPVAPHVDSGRKRTRRSRSRSRSRSPPRFAANGSPRTGSPAGRKGSPSSTQPGRGSSDAKENSRSRRSSSPSQVRGRSPVKEDVPSSPKDVNDSPPRHKRRHSGSPQRRSWSRSPVSRPGRDSVANDDVAIPHKRASSPVESN